MSLLVIGLGNPGNQYANTRHNLGFDVINTLAEQLSVSLKKAFFYPYMIGKGIHKGENIFLGKPLTYMNRSGNVLHHMMHYADASFSEIVVVCDHLDLDPGVCRLKTQGSSAGHKGLESIIHHAKTRDFMRFFIGIGRPMGNNVVDYVLSKPYASERPKIEDAIRKSASSILLLLEQSPAEVMNITNRKISDGQL